MKPEIFIFIASILLFPIFNLIHEMGHYLIWKLGRKPNLKLHCEQVTFKGSEEIFSEVLAGKRDDWILTLGIASGTFTNILFAFFGTFIYAITGSKLVFITGFSFIAVILFNLLMLPKIISGKTSNDEGFLEKVLNLPKGSVYYFTFILGFYLFYILVVQTIMRSESFFFLAALAGGGIGFVLWKKIFGSRILP